MSIPITKSDLSAAGLAAVTYGADWRDPTRYNGLYGVPGEYGFRWVADAAGRARSYSTARRAERAALKAGAAFVASAREA